MKKTNKIAGIILLMFMLMQFMTTAVCAENLAPQNVRWATEKELNWQVDVSDWIVWDYVDGYDSYILYEYKDGELLMTAFSERENLYNFGFSSLEDLMSDYGTGSYTVKVAVFDGTHNDFLDYISKGEEPPVLAVSEESVPNNYVGAPQKTNDTTITEPAQEETVTPPENNVPKTSSKEIECSLAAKVCYDLGFMPDVYENAGMIVTEGEFGKVTSALFNTQNSYGSSDKKITVGQICSRLAYAMMPIKPEHSSALASRLKAGVALGDDAELTYAQLAKIIYEAINEAYTVFGGNYYTDTDGSVKRDEYEIKQSGLLFEHGYTKYVGDVTVSGDTATVSGKYYSPENLYEIPVENVTLKVADKDLKSGSGYLLFVKDDTIISGISDAEERAQIVQKNLTQATVITLAIGNTNATVNGNTVANDTAPMIVNSRTMLPIRFVAEALGAKVGWDESAQAVTVTADNVNISLTVGQSSASVNGTSIALDAPSFIENGRTFLPLRFVAENLGANVSWDGTTQTVTITK